MIACHCRVVSDAEIADLIDRGVTDLGDLGDACGAGTRCGGCVPLLASMVEPTRGSLHRDPTPSHDVTAVAVRGKVSV